MKDKIFEYIKKVMSIAHIGSTYSKDEYALDNYRELMLESKKMMSEYSKEEIQPYDIFNEVYYPTPQPVVRVFVVRDNKIMFVKEAKEHDRGKWSLPGGWCDIDLTPAESAIKEVKEESGYDVIITHLMGVMDRRKYIKSKMYDTYNLFFMGEITGGSNNPNFEVLEVDWFSIDELPELSTKTTEKEVKTIWNHFTENTYAYFE